MEVEGPMKTAFYASAVFALGLLMGGTLHSRTRPQSRDEISRAIYAFTSAWDRSNAEALSQSFAPEGSLVIPQGMMIQGRTAIESFYSGVFGRGYQGSRAESSIKRITFLRHDIAFLDGEWSISGAHDTTGNKRAEERGIFFAVVVRRDRKWLIAALREQTSAAELRIPDK